MLDFVLVMFMAAGCFSLGQFHKLSFLLAFLPAVRCDLERWLDVLRDVRVNLYDD